MKIFSTLSDCLFKLFKIILLLILILVLCFIVKWRIDALYIDSLSKNRIEFTLKDEFDKSKLDLANLRNKNTEEQIVTPQPLLDENKNTNIVSITIPEGSNIDTIGDILIENHLMTDLNAFKTIVDNMGLTNKFTAGSFEINKDSKIKDTIYLLTDAKPQVYEIEIMPGAAADAVGKKLQDMGVIESGPTFAQNCKTYNVFYKFKPGKYKIETPVKVKVLIRQLTGENIQ